MGALRPQLEEIGRNLADEFKDLSNHFIGQGKELVKQKVDQWRTGPASGAEGARHTQAGRAGGTGYQAGGYQSGSTVSSESAGSWPTGGTAGGGTTAGAAHGSSAMGASGPETSQSPTPQGRESATGERRSGTGL
jgi:hypothetical protein